ncbi:hypothetical protein WICANDRAFT_61853 [Wickerhamomyces anomalus NRRL Y-366-8]|uniref:Uncharacterized protein n=1 Tax=Wickerhamomyces anomalus (strain ATCC 58044 / CBS 1984 / NCYC 433 / NRRL Y-366-8) TaxID=683960 RepID=A0A1E3P796_WICAA|nr:uncharacterized protein WICANDRAFT_61853 [Wickerhamomyces anomalus NRRL Y-366-8]ODQ61296.1 hypothetical protein WICANDRAFT_61853 [Wickerhamomyces anomalus NRRL Y-366-8]
MSNTDGDIEVKDAPADQRESRESTISASNQPTPNPITLEKPQFQQPNSTTQSPQIKHEELSSRNTPVPQVLQFQVPNDAKVSDIVGGAPVRQWLNENVTPTLLQGVRKISTERPQDPLRVLGEFLIKQSKVKSDQSTD